MHQHRLHYVCLLATLVFGITGTPAVWASVTCPAPATGAFTACYFSNTALSGSPALVRTDNAINFQWGNHSPHPSLPRLNFSVRWQGYFTLSEGNYTFNVIASDGMRLYVDAVPIIDRWRDQPPSMYKASRTLGAGSHLITVEYYERTGGAAAQVTWRNNSPGLPSLPVISSFTASPASTTPRQPVALSWNVSGATSIGIDKDVGDVTGRTSITVLPVQTTTYTLSASNSAGVSKAAVTVLVASSADTQVPTAPALVSATAGNAGQVDLIWTAASDNVGVAGYQILRNSAAVASVPGSKLTYTDTSAAPASTYTYIVKAYDASGNYSAASNSIRVTTPGSEAPSGPCPEAATGAFTGCYYDNTILSGDPVLVRTDTAINFVWGNKSPHPSLRPRDFSVRWQGRFTLGQGNYTFTATTSDGMRLYVDGDLIIDKWRDQAPFIYRASKTLTEGSHLIAVEYYERTGGATAQLTWQNGSPGTGPPPVISSFTATPASTTPGQPVTLSWNVSGATTISIDNGVGDATHRTSIAVFPMQTTTYTLWASNTAGVSRATVTAVVAVASDTQPPSPPVLVSATARSTGEVDLVWTAGFDNVGIAGYQVFRNGSVVASVPGAALTYTDTTANPGFTYTYALIAYDGGGNRSRASNQVSVTTPVSLPDVSVTWHGGCWQLATIYGVTGFFQAIDFVLKTPAPVPVQGTLFFGPDCNPNDGTDNMNDFNEFTGPTHMIRGFTFHPNEIPTSALYWVGNRTVDGKCPAGSQCSGCVNYTKSTPLCSALP